MGDSFCQCFLAAVSGGLLSVSSCGCKWGGGDSFCQCLLAAVSGGLLLSVFSCGCKFCPHGLGLSYLPGTGRSTGTYILLHHFLEVQAQSIFPDLVVHLLYLCLHHQNMLFILKAILDLLGNAFARGPELTS